MQKCKSAYGLCKGAKVGCTFRCQVSAIGYLLQVFRFRCRYGVNCVPKLITKNNLNKNKFICLFLSIYLLGREAMTSPPPVFPTAIR